MIVLLLQSSDISANNYKKYDGDYPSACATCRKTADGERIIETQRDMQSGRDDNNYTKDQADENLRAYKKHHEMQEREAQEMNDME